MRVSKYNCRTCGTTFWLYPCTVCSHRICVYHRFGISNSGKYFCSTHCVEKSIQRTKAMTKALIAVKAASAYAFWYLLALALIYIIYYVGRYV